MPKAIAEMAKYTAKSSDYLTDDVEENGHRVAILQRELHQLKMHYAGGILKDLMDELDEENADLVHITDNKDSDENAESLSGVPDVRLVTAGWRSNLGAYQITSRELVTHAVLNRLEKKTHIHVPDWLRKSADLNEVKVDEVEVSPRSFEQLPVLVQQSIVRSMVAIANSSFVENDRQYLRWTRDGMGYPMMFSTVTGECIGGALWAVEADIVVAGNAESVA